MASARLACLATMGFLEFRPQIKAARRDIPPERSLMSGPRVRPQVGTYLLWAGRPRRARRGRAMEVPLLRAPGAATWHSSPRRDCGGQGWGGRAARGVALGRSQSFPQTRAWGWTQPQLVSRQSPAAHSDSCSTQCQPAKPARECFPLIGLKVLLS